jgi:hypothetical protein
MKTVNCKNYTQAELDLIEKASQSRGTSKRIARRVSKQLKRSEIGVYIQVRKFRNMNKPTTVATPAQPAVKATKKEFVLNFTPKKTEVFQDHVRLYF